MAIYILVEGRRTEARLYPEWLKVLLPQFERSYDISACADLSYFLMSGNGMPRLLSHAIPDSIQDIMAHEIFSDFWVILDSDDVSVEERIEEVHASVQKCSLRVGVRVSVIVQRVCIETWLLGNKKIYSENGASHVLRRYRAKYDPKEKCPELLPVLEKDCTVAGFHLRFLKLLFEQKNICYSKTNPGHAKDAVYLKNLIRRVSENQLRSFQKLLDAVNAVKAV